MRNQHITGIGNHVWRETYAFIPAEFTEKGLPVFNPANITACVQYESALVKWVAGDESDFVKENPNRGMLTGVVGGENVYEKVINERLPLRGLRIGIAHRRATKKVCSLLGINAKTHLNQDGYKIMKEHLSD